MKPLNHKERDDKFLYFVIAGTITLGITIFCLYYTSDFLTDAIATKRVEEYSSFQRYRRNQQQYTRQLEQINKSLSDIVLDKSVVSKMITDFRTSFTRNGDTVAFMNRIADLSAKDVRLIELKKRSGDELNGVNKELIDCTTKLNK